MSRRISGSSAENGSSNSSSDGVAGQRAGQADPLLHAAGELVGVGAARSRSGRPGRPPRPPWPGAPSWLRRGSPGRRPRCRSPGGAAAGRSAGTPSTRGCGAARAAATRRRSVTSSPSMTTSPAVGSISRVRQRTSVDLPEPDRPITTKTSPGATSKDTSFTPTTQPVFSFRSARDRSASGRADDLVGARGRRSSTGCCTDRAAVAGGRLASGVAGRSRWSWLLLRCCGCRRAGRGGCRRGSGSTARRLRAAGVLPAIRSAAFSATIITGA